jgi:hypothetical protein
MSKTQTITSKGILTDVLRSAGVSMQVIATGDKGSGKKKVKQFFAVLSGEVLASIFPKFLSAVEDANSASEVLTDQQPKQPKLLPK